MHRNIVANAFFIDPENTRTTGDFDFAFISMDGGDAKRALVEHLEARGAPFIDVGMGVELVDEHLLGLLRVTLSTPEKREHVRENRRISFAGTGADALYAKNIQIADLNALNALLAIVRFKKYFDFYVDLEHEHFSAYAIDGNHLTNEDQG
jgi:hypothetical protein